MEIFGSALKAFPVGETLPGTKYKVKGLGKRHGEAAIVYFVLNSRNPRNTSEKGFTESELCHAHRQLLRAGEFTRAWFDSDPLMVRCGRGTPCNFLAIGAVFVGLGLAEKRFGLFAHKAKEPE